MEMATAKVLERLREAEARLEFLNREIRSLESEKQGYLKEIMKGGQRFSDVKRIDQALQDRSVLFSKTKEEAGNLRGQLERRLAKFRKQLVKEKQRELDRNLRRREGYLKRIRELELEASRYRYLVTGIKDYRLANVNNLLPSDIGDEDDSVPIDEAIGKIKLEVSEINRMNSEALLDDYLARETKEGQNA
jgi:hypothetical protein